MMSAMITSLRQSWILVLVSAWGAVLAPSAMAGTVLKKVQVIDPFQIDLVFDGKIDPAQVKLEAFNDILQVSVEDVAVYPAKILPVQNSEITKIFAYQYSPKLVRARFTVTGKAEALEPRVRFTTKGKIVSIRIESNPVRTTDKVVQSAAKADRAPVAGDAELLDRITKSQPQPQREAPTQIVKEKGKELTQKRKEVSAGPKNLPSPWRAIGALLAVLVLFLGGVMVMRRIKGKEALQIDRHRGLGKLLGKLGNLGIGAVGPQKKKTIEVLATHYLGPKNSIAVVKIGDRELVLGVTADSMNLITTLKSGLGNGLDAGDVDLSSIASEFGVETRGPHTSANGSGATSAGPALFSDILNQESGRPNVNSQVRAQIRSRLEGFKKL